MNYTYILVYIMIIMFGMAAAGGCDRKKNEPSSSGVHQESTEEKEAGGVVEVESASHFSKIIKDNDIVVVDFYADWCGPCRQLKPIIHDVARKFSGKAAVVAVNVDSLRELAVEHGISGIPDVRVFRGGSQVKQFVGVQPESSYSEYLRSITSK